MNFLNSPGAQILHALGVHIGQQGQPPAGLANPLAKPGDAPAVSMGVMPPVQPQEVPLAPIPQAYQGSGNGGIGHAIFKLLGI